MILHMDNTGTWLHFICNDYGSYAVQISHLLPHFKYILQAEIRRKLLWLDHERHCQSRGGHLPPPPLDDNIESLISEWFQLVRDDVEKYYFHEEPHAYTTESGSYVKG